MKKLKGSFAVKLAAVLLLTLMTAAFILSSLGIIMLAECGAYSGNFESAQSSFLDGLGHTMSYKAGNDFLNGRSPEAICSGKDFCFEVYDAAGERLIFSNYDGQEIIQSWETMVYNPYPVIAVAEGSEIYVEYYGSAATPMPTLTPSPTTGGTDMPTPTGAPIDETAEASIAESADTSVTEPTESPVPTAAGTALPQPTAAPAEAAPVTEERASREMYYTVKGYFLREDRHPGDMISFCMGIFSHAFYNRALLIPAAALSLLLAAASLIFLLSAAGHRKGSDSIEPRFTDKIPYDLFLLLLGAGIMGFGAMAAELLMWTEDVSGVIGGAVLALCAFELSLLLLLSTATRIKLKSVFKNTVCYKIISFCLRLIKKAFGLVAKAARNVPLMKKGLLAFGVLMLIEFMWIVLNQYSLGGQLIGWFIESLAFGALLFYVLGCSSRLRAGAAALAAGEEAARVDTKNMKGPFREHAKDLNRIGEGIEKAVEERMKSERFKTELITNVSHDIKTPLTSIVSYVDLLGKEEPENEKMREYIGVLSRQAARLKKLIEDLMEASKAASGNLPVNFRRLAIGVLMDQIAGEYGERLAEKGLEPVLIKPEEELYVLADGRHMWRIADNLMGNILKYAQSGTRVYLGAERKGAEVLISFRNISASRLSLSGEELTERFVRGDSSRSSEGSGLGLSIAESLTRLQRGKMTVSIDGDLFKVLLRFRAAEPGGSENKISD